MGARPRLRSGADGASEDPGEARARPADGRASTGRRTALSDTAASAGRQAPPVKGGAGSEFAPAKINLALHLVGRRADGYHLLESLVVFAADVGDTVDARFSNSQSLTVGGPFGTPLTSINPWENLVTRAHDIIGQAHPFSFTVTKRIPVAAGLGGGSADAAATLRLLNRLLDLRLSPERVAEMGRPLGADVPMCVLSRPLVARGVGEQLAPLQGMPALPMVLACPPVAVRTPDVFARVTNHNRGWLRAVPMFATVEDMAAWLAAATRNDLAEPAVAVSPAAATAAAALSRAPGCLFARMTGSGPSAFGLFKTRAAADAAAARLAAAEPTWWVQAAITGGS